jgi:hypothetical protein
VRVYGLNGRLVAETRKSDEGNVLLWDVTNGSEALASGLYYAVIEDEDSGEKVIVKLAIVN